MSKFVIYILDKVVWILLITALTTQALQMAGIVQTPKTFGDISYKQENEYNFNIAAGNQDIRDKRQTDGRSQLIDNLFNIPISTLNAINNLVQSARPAFRKLREYAQRRLDKSNKIVKVTTTTPKPMVTKSGVVTILSKPNKERT